MKRCINSASTSISTWNIETINQKANAFAYEIATEALDYIFEGNNTYVTFACIFEDEADPDILHLHVGMEEMDGDDKPTFEFKLSEIVDDFIDAVQEGNSRYIVEEEVHKALRLSAFLRSEAARIESHCREEHKHD